jgi:hypothetical protein
MRGGTFLAVLLIVIGIAFVIAGLRGQAREMFRVLAK